MKVILCWLFLLMAVGATAADRAKLGYRNNTVTEAPLGEDVCPGTALLSHDDGSFENGFAWRGGGVVPPDYGAWAECYESQYLCGIQFVFSANYVFNNMMDVYVWESLEGGDPPPGPDSGNVLCVILDVSPWPIAIWPEIPTHDIQVCCEVPGTHFVGYWGNWPGLTNAWFTLVDIDGPGTGCPRTKATETNPPAGWEHPTPYFGTEIQGVGIRMRSNGVSNLTSALVTALALVV